MTYVLQEMLDVVPALLRHCGAGSRVGDLYSDRTLATRFATRARANLRVSCCLCGAVCCKSAVEACCMRACTCALHGMWRHRIDAYTERLLTCYFAASATQAVWWPDTASTAATVADMCAGCRQGVQNVYTQHTPLLMQTLELLAKGKLPEADYPHIALNAGQGTPHVL